MAVVLFSTAVACRIPGARRSSSRFTGKDAPVIEYLEHQESAARFLAHATALVEGTISSYQQRGFKNLMVSFGCTGGQHRSVYLAEQLAKRLQGRPGVEVAVRHLELEKMGR